MVLVLLIKDCALIFVLTWRGHLSIQEVIERVAYHGSYMIIHLAENGKTPRKDGYLQHKLPRWTLMLI